jgi:hypothetical protein
MTPTRRQFLASMAAGIGARLAQPLPLVAAGSPLVVYPELERRLRIEADRRATTLGPDSTLRLDGATAIVAPDLADTAVDAARRSVGPTLPPDGLAVWAIDVPQTTYVAGTVEIVPPRDLRPGLRATVLSDTTIVGVPMLSAPAWGIDDVTDPAPFVEGRDPPRLANLAEWRLTAGRHYLTVAGPHFRSAGQLLALTLRTTGRPVDEPLYRFALIGDTHVRFEGREDWMNRKMGEATAAEFARTLHALAAEGLDFVVHGGDMTERARREEFALMAGILESQPLPVYGCIGNHDRYLVTSRPDARELLADHFPGRELSYQLVRPPLRFVVFDVEIEEPAMQEHQRAWLRDSLAADRDTPTVVVWHYAPFNRGGVSSCGFRLHDWSELGKKAVLDVVRDAPHVFATLNGHDHWDEVNVVGGLTHIQNAAFVEWPNSYRVFGVYADRIEWEVRQVGNRGFIRESFLPDKAVSWMIATGEDDLTGTVSYRR